MGENPRARQPHVILFLGAPGSGKGTQSAWLSERLGIPSLSTGDMLRAEAKRKTRAGSKLRAVMASGLLVDDQLVCEAVKARLQRDLRGGPMILDGFPRTLVQAECLDRTLAEMRMPSPVVLHLDVAREKLVGRITSRRHCGKCGAIYNLLSRPSAQGTRCENDGTELQQREDDSEAVIRRRLMEFDLSCAPLVEHYSHGDYHRIDGDREPLEISAELLRIVAYDRVRAAA
jgi:adenylate kinase